MSYKIFGHNLSKINICIKWLYSSFSLEIADRIYNWSCWQNYVVFADYIPLLTSGIGDWTDILFSWLDILFTKLVIIWIGLIWYFVDVLRWGFFFCQHRKYCRNDQNEVTLGTMCNMHLDWIYFMFFFM